MPFPSSGCQTCRARHIKCDETRPTCLNCRKSRRHCAGWRSSGGSLLFLNENIYASTQKARPRGGARWVPEASADDLSILHKDRSKTTASPATGSDGEIHRSSQSITPPTNLSRSNPWIPPSPNRPLEDLALHHFAHLYFRESQPSADNQWTLLKSYFYPTSQLPDDGILSLSFAAHSLGQYGRLRGISAAITEGRRKYSRALTLIRNSIQDKKTVLADEMLISVMIMAAYENNDANFDQQKLFSYSFQHHTGAAVLLKLRKEHRSAKCLPNSIDHCYRRLLIKGCAHRAAPVPDWLHNGADFGEEEHQLGLDSAFIKLAYLRHQLTNTLYNGDAPVQLLLTVNQRQIETLIDCAVEILHHFSEWRANLAPEYHYIISHGDQPLPPRPSASLFYSSEMYIYHSIENAGMWSRYYGARILLHCMIFKLLFVWRHIIKGDASKYRCVERLSQADAQMSANDVCASIPYGFGIDFDNQNDLKTIIHNIQPVRVYSLVWSLIFLCGSQWLNDLQRQWLREKMLIISQATGNQTLDKIANMNLQYHPRIRQEALLMPEQMTSPRLGLHTIAYRPPTVG